MALFLLALLSRAWSSVMIPGRVGGPRLKQHLTPSREDAVLGRITAADVPTGCGQTWVWGLFSGPLLRSPIACSRNCNRSGALAAWWEAEAQCLFGASTGVRHRCASDA